MGHHGARSGVSVKSDVFTAVLFLIKIGEEEEDGRVDRYEPATVCHTHAKGSLEYAENI